MPPKHARFMQDFDEPGSPPSRLERCCSVPRKCVGIVSKLVSKAIFLLSEPTMLCVVLRQVIAVSFLVAGIYNLRLLSLSHRDMQLQIWLGGLPFLTLLTLSGALSILAGIFAYAQYIVIQRKYQNTLKRWFGATRFHETEFRSPCSLSTLNFLLTSVVVLAMTSLALGVVVMRSTNVLTMALTPRPDGGYCGLGGTSKQLEVMHQELRKFHDECLQSPANDGKLIQECPGFATAFPEPSPPVSYLRVLEETMQCTGFCHIGQRPLFMRRGLGLASLALQSAPTNDDAPAASHLLRAARRSRLRSRIGASFLGFLAHDSHIHEARRTCSAKVGDHLRSWSSWAAVPAVALAPLLALLGMALLCYEEL